MDRDETVRCLAPKRRAFFRGMKSGPLYLGVLTASAAVWLALYLELAIPLSPSGQQVVSAVRHTCVALSDSRRAHGACLLSRMSCSQLPCLALIWFGCWSLGTISLNLIHLRECTDAAVELREQIAAARNDLRARGLGDIFDADAK